MDARRIRIGRGDHVRIRDGNGAVVRIDRGTAWLTQDGDRRDHVIEAAGLFRLDRGGAAVLSSNGVAELTVTAAPARAMPAIEISMPRAAGRTARPAYGF